MYKYLPYDIDLDTRKAPDPNIIFNIEEMFIIIFFSLLIFISYSLPYMYLLISGVQQNAVNTILITTILYSNIFITLVLLSEKPMFKNLLYIIKNIRLLIYSLTIITFSVITYYCNVFDTIKIGIQNYFACILISFIFTSIIEITKLARYTSLKGGKKSVKNNQKKRRS